MENSLISVLPTNPANHSTAPGTRHHDRGTRTLVLAACLVVVIAGLKEAAAVALPVLLALFLAIISLPLQKWLERKKVPLGFAVLLTLVTVLAVLIGIGMLVGGTVNRFLANVGIYEAKLTQLTDQSSAWLLTFGIETPDWFREHRISPNFLLDMVTKGLLSATGLLSNLALILLVQAFIMLEAGRFPAKWRMAMRQHGSEEWNLNRVAGEVQIYFGVKTLVSLITGLVAGFWCWLFGVDYYLLWGFLGFVLNYIPNIGSVMAALPPMLLALVQYGWGTSLIIGAGYCGINMWLGNIVEPRLMGQRLGLSPLVVMLSLVFWGWVWGSVGMLLSIPLTMFVKILLENTGDLRWLAIMLSDSAEEPPPLVPAATPALVAAGDAAPVVSPIEDRKPD